MRFGPSYDIPLILRKDAVRCRSRHPSGSCLFATGFKRAALAGPPRRTVTRNLKPIASRTFKTVVKFGFFGSPANAR